MTKAHRNINIAAVFLPFVAFLAAVPMLWNNLVGPTDLILLVSHLRGLGRSGSPSASTGC